MKRRPLVALVSLAVLAFAVPALAEGVYIKTHFQYYDSPVVLIPGFEQKFPVIGGGAEVGGRFGPDSPWAWNIGGGYSVGGLTFEPAGGGKDKLNVTSWYGRAGVDYHTQAGPADLYCGPSLFYSSSKLEVEQTGFPTQEFEPLNFIGIENRVGSGVPIGGGNTKIYGEASSIFGRGSIDDDANVGGKHSSWSSSMGYRGGVMFNF